MRVYPDTYFRLSPTSGTGLPPIVVVAASGPFHVQTYWTPEQAREFAAQLTAMAQEVES